PIALAKASEDCTAKRGPNKPVYSAASPVVSVRGVACRMTCPTRKSSKKLPGLFLDMTFTWFHMAFSDFHMTWTLATLGWRRQVACRCLVAPVFNRPGGLAKVSPLT